jgi:hypothetical protein
MPDAPPRALGMHQGESWTLEVHAVDDNALLTSSSLLLSGLELPAEKVLDMLLVANHFERTSDWTSRPEGVWVAEVRPATG